MSIKLMSTVWEDAPFQQTALLVLLALADHASDDGTCWPAVGRIAQRARCSERRVQQILSELEEVGWLERRRRFNDTTLYVVKPTSGVKPTSPGEAEFTGGVKPVSPPPVKPSSQRGEAGFTLTTKNHQTEPPENRHAQELVAEWIDHCSQRPPRRVIGHLSKEIKALLDEGIPYDDVRNGVAEWHRKGLHPSTLASVVHEIRNPRRPAGRPTTDDKVLAGLALARQLRGAEQHQPHQIGA